MRSWLKTPLFFAVLVLISLARAYAGLFGIIAYPHDVFALIDPAWRILHHQIPHIDFYSQLGPVPYLETAMGLKLARGGIQGLVYGQVLCGFLTAVWVYLISSSRLPRLIRYVLTIYVLTLGVAPFNVGEGFSVLSAAMSYNRLSYGLSGIVLVEVLTRKSDGKSDLFGGLSTGAALGLLLFTKITFFAGALVTVAGLSLVFPKTRQRWIGLASAFGVVTFGFFWYLQFGIGAILQDYRISAGAKHLGPAKVLLGLLEAGSAEGVSLAMFSLFIGIILRTDVGKGLARRSVVAGFFTLLLSSFLLVGNFQGRGLPLNACFALIAAGWLLQQPLPNQTSLRQMRTALAAWAILMAGWPTVTGLAGISYAVLERAGGAVPLMRSPGLAAFRIRDRQYASFLDDGVFLASQHRKANEKIESPEFSDFFSYALRTEPPHGGASCLQFDSTFNYKSHPSPERLFGGADIVMMPVKFSEDGSQQSIPRIYGPFLNSHFHLEASSAQWRLYRRNL